MRNQSLSLLIICSTLFSACGGDNETADLKAISSVTPDTLDHTLIPNGFYWRMQNTHKINFKLVSIYNQRNGEFAPISGQHYLEVYSLDKNSQRSHEPFIKLMTNIYGEALLSMSLQQTWAGIIVNVNVNGKHCSNTVDKSNLSSNLAIMCDITVSSDL